MQPAMPKWWDDVVSSYVAPIYASEENARKARESESDGRFSVSRGTGAGSLIWGDRVRVVAGWCELRRDIRHFRVDRIVALNVSEERYPRRRHALLKEWRESEDTQPGAEILSGR